MIVLIHEKETMQIMLLHKYQSPNLRTLEESLMTNLLDYKFIAT